MGEDLSGPRALRHSAGYRLLIAASVGRLPYAMNVVGVFTLLTVTTGSVATASLGSALLGLSVAFGAPAVGWFADRHGDRAALLVAVPVHCAALIALVAGAATGQPYAVLLALCALAGMTTPQLSPLMRARWVALLRRRPQTLPLAMGYESLLDELSFAVGPIIVGAAASLFNPGAALLASAAITSVFATLFATDPARTSPRPRRIGARTGRWVNAEVVIVIVGMLLLGATFGATLAIVSAYTQRAGIPASSGLVYASMATAAAIASMIVPFLVHRTATSSRWLFGAALVAAGVVSLSASENLTSVTIALAVTGLGVGTLMVTIYSIVGRITPSERMATMMTVLGGVTGLGSAGAVTIAAQFAAAGPSGPLTIAATVFAAIVVAIPLLRVLLRTARPVSSRR
ncbi:MFS transporter [Microbacterium sp.]|uniref:MFS transporter n=1 Tax=Microbacterium sp. TaxID=51671 RepID=UPI003A8C4992